MLAVQMQGLHMRIRISSYQLFSALRTTYPLILHSFASHNTATSLDLSRIFLLAAAQCVALGTTSRTVCTARTACSGAPHSYTSGSLPDISSSAHLLRLKRNPRNMIPAQIAVKRLRPSPSRPKVDNFNRLPDALHQLRPGQCPAPIFHQIPPNVKGDAAAPPHFLIYSPRRPLRRPM